MLKSLKKIIEKFESKRLIKKSPAKSCLTMLIPKHTQDLFPIKKPSSTQTLKTFLNNVFCFYNQFYDLIKQKKNSSVKNSNIIQYNTIIL